MEQNKSTFVKKKKVLKKLHVVISPVEEVKGSKIEDDDGAGRRNQC